MEDFTEKVKEKDMEKSEAVSRAEIESSTDKLSPGSKQKPELRIRTMAREQTALLKSWKNLKLSLVKTLTRFKVRT